MRDRKFAVHDMKNITAVPLDLSPTINNVSVSLYGAAASTLPSGNLMISPISILYASALLYLGARKSTRTNLYDSLDFKEFSKDGTDADVTRAFGQLMKDLKLQGPANVTGKSSKTGSEKGAGKTGKEKSATNLQDQFQLALANGVFLQETLNVDQNYLSLVSTKLNAAIEKKNFVKNSDAVRVDINKWAAERTGGKIPKAIPPGGVDSSTVAVLINAIYFKAQWDQRFLEKDTDQKATFHTLDGKSVPAKMMTMSHGFMYAQDSKLDVQYLEIPYANNEASFLVFLPKKVTGLRDLEKALTAQSITELANKAYGEYRVDLRLPKFRLESSFDLVELLQKIGVNDAFTENADLTGIVPIGGLQVSKGFHKTFIEVDEKGTEAAAVSAIALVDRSMPRTIVFHADHPFMYAIRHNRSKAILFMGRVETP